MDVLKKILNTFGFGLVQDCEVLFDKLEKEQLSLVDLKIFIENQKKSPQSMPSKKQVKKENKTLKPGDLLAAGGIVCCKCHGEIYITAVCCSNPLKRQGFTRKGICAECGNEFGIR